MKNIFIGADGGGTKTKIQIEDENGNILGVGKGGPGNIRTSVKNSWNSIMAGLSEALTQAGLSLDDPHYAYHAGFGLAGYEVPEAVKDFLAYPHTFKTMVLESDAIIACLGAHAGEDGAIIIVGTGVHGCAVYQDDIIHVGGWGFPHGDEGGGAWLGMEAVRLTLRSVDGRAHVTPLCEAVLNKFNGSVTELVIWAVEAKPGDFGTLAPLVIEYAGFGDPHALMLLDSAAAEIDLVAQALEDAIDHACLDLTLFGGIAPHLKERLSPAVRKRLVDRQFDATRGAIFLVRQKVLGDDWKKGIGL